ncbi:MAG: YdjY domain-containing protein [Candidatus Firestonebacteria bacterium]
MIKKIVVLLAIITAVVRADLLFMYEDTSVSGRILTIKDKEVFFKKDDGKTDKKSLFEEISRIEVRDRNLKKVDMKKQSAIAVLVNGDRISGDVIEFNGSTLALSTCFGEITLVANSLSALIIADDGTPFPVDKNFTVLILKNGDELKCFLKTIKDGKVNVSSDLGELELAFDRVKKIVMPVMGRRDLGGRDFIATLQLVNKDRYSGRYFGFSSGKYSIEPMWTIRTKQPFFEFEPGMVDNITFKNTGAGYLSDLNPREVKETPYFNFHLPWKSDSNLKGTVIKINNVEYKKGVSCQAKTELVYKLDGGCASFSCLAGIEDSAAAGNAVLIISLDGNRIFEKKLEKGAEAGKITADLKGVKDLKITVDFGDAGDSGAFVSLANPVLVKVKEGKEEAVKIAEGVYKIGSVTADKNKRELSFPAKVEMKEGLIEYLAVNGEGKAYESLLTSDTRPVHLQVGLILLGLEYGQNINVRNDSAEPKGSKVDIFVEIDGKRLGMKEIIFDRVKKCGLENGDFVFSGSKIAAGAFLAEQEGSLIAAFKDPGAVIVYASPTIPDASGYSAYDSNIKNLAETGKPVTVIIKPK